MDKQQKSLECPELLSLSITNYSKNYTNEVMKIKSTMILPPIKMTNGAPKSSKKVPQKTEATRFRPKELSIGVENLTVCNIIPQIQTPKVKLRPDLQLVNSNISAQKNIRVIARD